MEAWEKWSEAAIELHMSMWEPEMNADPAFAEEMNEWAEARMAELESEDLS